MTGSTKWTSVLLLFLTGALTAHLVTKAPVVLALLQQEFDLSVFQAGLLVSIFSLIAALFGTVMGALSDRSGQRRTALVGLLVAGLASCLATFAPSAVWVLVGRFLEGFGFFLVSTSIPPLMLRAANPQDRQKVMGLWGAFLPTGAAAILLTGGWIATEIGWRGLWWVSSGLLVIAAAMLIFVTRDMPRQSSPRKQANLVAAYALIFRSGPLLLGLTFVGYSAQYMVVTAFLPLALIQDANWTIAQAGIAGGIVFGFNVVGNIASGFLLDRGVRRRNLILFGAACMAIGAVGFFYGGLPPMVRLVFAVLFSALGGILPGALFAGVERHAPDPSKVSQLHGLLMQGAATGQLIGPPFAAAFLWVGTGWQGVLVFMLPAALFTACCGVALGVRERRLLNTVPDS